MCLAFISAMVLSDWFSSGRAGFLWVCSNLTPLLFLTYNGDFGFAFLVVVTVLGGGLGGGGEGALTGDRCWLLLIFLEFPVLVSFDLFFVGWFPTGRLVVTLVFAL